VLRCANWAPSELGASEFAARGGAESINQARGAVACQIEPNTKTHSKRERERERMGRLDKPSLAAHCLQRASKRAADSPEVGPYFWMQIRAPNLEQICPPDTQVRLLVEWSWRLVCSQFAASFPLQTASAFWRRCCGAFKLRVYKLAAF